MPTNGEIMRPSVWVSGDGRPWVENPTNVPFGWSIQFEYGWLRPAFEPTIYTDQGTVEIGFGR